MQISAFTCTPGSIRACQAFLSLLHNLTIIIGYKIEDAVAPHVPILKPAGGASPEQRAMAPDRTLAARLEALLPTMEEGTDIDDIVSTLRDRHAEYRRHKTGPFKQLVLRALEAVRKKHPELFGGDSEVGGGCTECGCPLRSRVPRISAEHRAFFPNGRAGGGSECYGSRR